MQLLRQLEDNLLPSTMAEIIVAIENNDRTTRNQVKAQREIFAMLVNNVGFVNACKYVAEAQD